MTKTIELIETWLDSETARHGVPAPLIAVAYDIRIRSGLAVVEAIKTFRNDEATSIEAVLTFPVPVRAVLFELQAQIGGRTIKAKAARRDAAREDYEAAIDDGKTAALHEELMPGIHMLSLGHVPPGSEIVVTAVWAQTMQWADGAARMRIPQTVGMLYGASPFSDPDDLVTGGETLMATVSVNAGAARVVASGRAVMAAEAYEVPTNRPIDISVSDMTFVPVIGRAADGAPISLSITPLPASDHAVDLAILVDRSGSMDAPIGNGGAGMNQLEAVRAGLHASAETMRKADAVDLWQFDQEVERIGGGNGSRMASLAAKLGSPRGGTEIGGSLAAVMAGPEASDILLITDGQSYALDVQALAQKGRTITVVLVGVGSLEANVGRLAALTGGDIFVAAESDIAPTISAAVASIRRRAVSDMAPASDGVFAAACLGMQLIVSPAPADEESEDKPFERAAAAVAASLRLRSLSEDEATRIAVAEGLCTHLTSLVLTDEVGEAQVGLPAFRKVALPPVSSMRIRESRFIMLSMDVPDISSQSWLRRALGGNKKRAQRDEFVRRRELRQIAKSMRWDAPVEAFIGGDLAKIAAPDIRRLVRSLLADDELAELAKRHDIVAMLVLIGLAALIEDSVESRRIADAVLGDAATSVDILAAAGLLEPKLPLLEG